jgi:hypothetical protein
MPEMVFNAGGDDGDNNDGGNGGDNDDSGNCGGDDLAKTDASGPILPHNKQQTIIMKIKYL